MKIVLSQLSSDTLEQNFESYDHYEEESNQPKYEKIATKQLDQGKWFYNLLSSKDGILSNLPQNFVHSLKETHWNESDIAEQLDNLVKESDITVLPWKVDIYSFVKQGENLDDDASYYVVTFSGKRDGIEWKHSITISHLGEFDIYPNTEITHIGEAMDSRSDLGEKQYNLQQEIQRVIQAREGK